MLQRLKKFFGLGEVFDEARKGNMSRRNFLQAVAALGVLPEEADKELGKRVYAVPGPKIILNPWQEALLGGWAAQSMMTTAFAMVANVMQSEEGKWTVSWQDRPAEKSELEQMFQEIREDRGIIVPDAPKIEGPATVYATPGGGIIQVGSSWK